jgi:hypothetical protein
MSSVFSLLKKASVPFPSNLVDPLSYGLGPVTLHPQTRSGHLAYPLTFLARSFADFTHRMGSSITWLSNSHTGHSHLSD